MHYIRKLFSKIVKNRSNKFFITSTYNIEKFITRLIRIHKMDLTRLNRSDINNKCVNELSQISPIRLLSVGFISVFDEVIQEFETIMTVAEGHLLESRVKLSVPQTLPEKLKFIDVNELITNALTLQRNDELLTKQIFFIKLQTVIKILKQFLQDMDQDNDGADNFIREIRNFLTMEDDENKLYLDAMMRKKHASDLRKQIVKERFEGLCKIQNATHFIGKLKDDIQDVIVENGLKIEYVLNWEKSQLDQTQYRNRLKENEYRKKIAAEEQLIEEERIINNSIKSFYDVKMLDTLNLIKEWNRKYQEDTSAIDREIKLIRTDLQNQKILLTDRTNLYQERKKKIQEYLQYKEKKRLEQEFLEYLDRSATKIEAWWRGCMVRHYLGPYRKRRGKMNKKEISKKNKTKAK